MPASYNKKSSPQSISMGVQGGISALYTFSGAVGLGFPGKEEEDQGCVYVYGSQGVGLAAGGGVGIEYGCWWDPPEGYNGRWWGVEGSFAAELGAAVGLYFNNKMQFLGFLIVPQAGLEAELKIVLGETALLHKWTPNNDDDE